MSPQTEHLNIVALEEVHCPMPKFQLPSTFTHTLTTYQWTNPPEIAERVKDAAIIITTTAVLTKSILDPSCTPKLRIVVIMATGTDCVDKEAAKARGIPVCNCPETNIESVSEHALGLYFATRRKLLPLDAATRVIPGDPSLDTEWKTKGSLRQILRSRNGKAPLTCSEETVGILGYGALGKRIAAMAKGLGMTVLLAERRGSLTRPGRTSFEDTLKRSTVLILCLPRDPETLGLISAAELQTMPPEAVLINVSRGGIVDETALLQALKDGRISGAGTDVFTIEPAGRGDSPLLSEEAKGQNLVLTPHLAWLAERTLSNLQDGVKTAVESWCVGNIINRVA